jgi:hypothetical protein
MLRLERDPATYCLIAACREMTLAWQAMIENRRRSVGRPVCPCVNELRQQQKTHDGSDGSSIAITPVDPTSRAARTAGSGATASRSGKQARNKSMSILLINTLCSSSISAVVHLRQSEKNSRASKGPTVQVILEPEQPKPCSAGPLVFVVCCCLLAGSSSVVPKACCLVYKEGPAEF